MGFWSFMSVVVVCIAVLLYPLVRAEIKKDEEKRAGVGHG